VNVDVINRLVLLHVDFITVNYYRIKIASPDRDETLADYVLNRGMSSLRWFLSAGKWGSIRETMFFHLSSSL
jgi:hypothetical protein